MKIRFLDPNEAEHCREAINIDPEFKLAAEYMSENVLLGVGDSRCLIKVYNGAVVEIRQDPNPMIHCSFAIRAPDEFWEKFLQPSPPPFHSLYVGMIRGLLKIEGNLEAAFAHFWALTRVLDILRELQNE
jgi:hypothetical protein